jgi:hypothetical protein
MGTVRTRVGEGLHAGPFCSEVATTFGDPHTADVEAADRGSELAAIIIFEQKRNSDIFTVSRMCCSLLVFPSKILGPTWQGRQYVNSRQNDWR